VDPLSDILTLLNVRAALSSRLEAAGEWSLAFGGYQHIKVGVVLAGSCVLAAEGAPALHLGTGDCYLLAGGHAYRVGSGLDVPPHDGHAVYRAAAGARTVRYRCTADTPDRTVVVGGSITFDDATAALLLDSLPATVRIAADSAPARVLRPSLELLADETTSARPGAALMTEHLTHILFVQALRAHLDAVGDAAGRGWLGALNDSRIGAALTLMHEEAARRWTVADLAVAVGMSRSSFAEHFKNLVGLAPLDYLLQWRIRSAANALRTSDRTVASVAAEWGYGSESAFSAAFKRVTGHPPARYRGMALGRAG
jgi:AraC-like DNA-binding protein